MRKLMLAVVPFVLACARGEEASADSAAAAPAALTDADIAGNWSGNLMTEADSVIGTWSETCGGGTCRLVVSMAPKDTISLTYVIDGDSIRYTAAAHADPSLGGAMVTDAGAGHITASQITGKGTVKFADKDSVAYTYKFTGTKAP